MRRYIEKKCDTLHNYGDILSLRILQTCLQDKISKGS